MWLFFGGILFLIIGYFVYGKFMERLLHPDDRVTPAVQYADGVDYLILPHWKNMLIQLLNIAGIGPVIGVILGIKFGLITFLIIPLGCVLMGSVHDFVSGMMSLRNRGANLPVLVEKYLGSLFGKIFSFVMVGILLLVVAVFINVPANLVNIQFIPNNSVASLWMVIGVIFVYYVIATLFPMDKIIGRIYPVFGAMLLFGSLAIFCALSVAVLKDSTLLTETETFKAGMFKVPKAPVFPLLFVTIACGIISGFHATQSPLIARTMKSEREARSNFYGMMILEGIIAMIWAAAAMAMFNIKPEVMTMAGPKALGEITMHFLGKGIGSITIIAVIILAITSGDTALRSTRLSLAEHLKLNQSKLISRLFLVCPLVVIVMGLLIWSSKDAKSFNHLWNYFAWGNQVIAAVTLMTASSWMIRHGHRQGALVTLLPGLFMTTVVVSFILWTRLAYGQPRGIGFTFEELPDGSFQFSEGLPLGYSIAIGIVSALGIAFFVVRHALRNQEKDDCIPAPAASETK